MPLNSGHIDLQAKEIKWEKYKGEMITTKTILRKGKMIHEREFFKDRVKAVPKGNAYIIGNGPSRKNFNLNTLKASGQTYGCNALYRDFMPDFIFSVDTKMTTEMVMAKVGRQTIHYGPSLEVNRKHAKGMIHLIPNNPHFISGNQAIWTATVHGHKNIYLIGFDFQEYGKDQLNNIYQDTLNYGERHSDTIFDGWLRQFRQMIKQRPYCNFTVVHDNPPEYLNYLQTGTDLKNTFLMSYKEFNEKVLDRTA